MPADGGEDLLELARGGDRLPVRALVHADREDPPDAGIAGRGDELGVGRLAGAEVCVAVDHSPQYRGRDD